MIAHLSWVMTFPEITCYSSFFLCHPGVAHRLRWISLLLPCFSMLLHFCFSVAGIRTLACSRCLSDTEVSLFLLILFAGIPCFWPVPDFYSLFYPLSCRDFRSFMINSSFVVNYFSKIICLLLVILTNQFGTFIQLLSENSCWLLTSQDWFFLGSKLLWRSFPSLSRLSNNG